MAKKKGPRQLFGLRCPKHGLNYITEANKNNITLKGSTLKEALKLIKYCKDCREHVPHTVMTKLK